jgi:hypothetical protein
MLYQLNSLQMSSVEWEKIKLSMLCYAGRGHTRLLLASAPEQQLPDENEEVKECPQIAAMPARLLCYCCQIVDSWLFSEHWKRDNVRCALHLHDAPYKMFWCLRQTFTLYHNRYLVNGEIPQSRPFCFDCQLFIRPQIVPQKYHNLYQLQRQRDTAVDVCASSRYVSVIFAPF